MRSRVTRSHPSSWLVAAVIGALVAAPLPAAAQYFGRNKVQYEQFDFRVVETPHLDVHFYPAESLAASDLGRMGERWYQRLSPLMRSTFDKRSVILYANSPDFQQTNVVGGLIDQSTGGVTESVRGRVTMPLQSTFGESDHVLGHELVHVFQYNIAFGGDAANARGLNTIPLWVIEGMAEYLSKGRYDPLTAMWLRDAMRRNDLPTLKQLSNSSKYFPYRYGQAFWAWFAGRFGDQAVERVYRAALRQGWEQGLLAVTGRNSDSLSAAWHRDIRTMYEPMLAGRTPPDSTGTAIVRGNLENAEANVSPIVSADGRHVAFFSSRDLFGYALFVADAHTGRIIKRLTSVTGDPHFDAISFINSAGSFSPDGEQLAFVVYSEGDNELDIYDVNSGKVERRIKLGNVGGISDPAWSPDGAHIAVSGNAGGISDLYMVELASGRVEQLTRGRAAELQPAWSPDGRTLAYTTDQGAGYDPANLTFGETRIGLLDLETRQTRILPGLGSGKHINPQFSPDGADIFLVSDQDGFADIYRVVVASGEAFRVTRSATGISGITTLSPAITVARQDGRLLFSTFQQGGFSIRALAPAEMRGTPVVPAAPAVAEAGLLPPLDIVSGTVARYLADASTGLPTQPSSDVHDYRSKLTLDYVGVPSAGFGVSSQYGALVNGAVAAVFGDELNNRNVGAAVIAQGTLKDIGGQVYYLNREHRWNWLASASRTPYLSLGYQYSDGGQGTVNYDQVYVRQYFDDVSGGLQYPFSISRRIEFNAGVERISYDFSADRLILDGVSGGVIGQQQNVKLPTPPAISLAQSSVAYVGDHSFFAFTSPVAGARYRFEYAPTFGDLTFQTVTADYRHYFLLRPVTFAVRALHYGRYGSGSEDGRLYPIYLGNPQLVRGYESGSFSLGECSGGSAASTCPEFERLLGSRLAVASAEIRIPLLGTNAYGLINAPFLPTELSFFADAGAAWYGGETPNVRFIRETTDRVPVTSVGTSARINVLGYAVVELYYALPFQRPGKSGVFGFQIAPGW